MKRNSLPMWACATCWIWLQVGIATGQVPESATKTQAKPSGAVKAEDETKAIQRDGAVEFSMRSPRATIRSFVVAMEKKDLRTATSLMDFSQMSPAPDTFHQVEYGQMLKSCIDRMALIDPELISDEPDGPEATFPPDKPDSVIRLAKGQDQKWRFTPSTLEGLPALFDVLKKQPKISKKTTTEPKPKEESESDDTPEKKEESEQPETTEAQAEPIPDHLRSARRVMRTLFESLDESQYEQAVSTLDFSQLLETEPDLGPYAKLQQARRLEAVIERMQDFEYGSISDDPEGPVFRFPMEESDQPVAISRGESGVWQFSAGTVASIDSLYEIYRDRQVVFLTGERRPWYRRELIMDNEVWRIMVLFGAIFAGLVIGRLLGLLAQRRAQTLKSHDRLVQSLTFETIAKTVPIILLLIGLAVGLENLVLGFKVELLAGTVLRVVLTLIIGYFLFRLVDVVVGFLRDTAKRSGSTLNEMLVPIVSTSLRLTIIVLVLLEIATIVSDKPPSAVIAGLGAGGLAIGLAAQDTIKNFFGSLLIFADRPFELGERIVIDGHDGPVETVGFRSTRIRTLDGHLVTVPNGEMAAKTIQNIGRRPYIRRILNIRIPFNTPPEKVQQALDVLRELLDQHEGCEPDFPPRVFLNDFLESAINIRAIYWFHPPAYWDFCDFGERLNMQIIERFRDAGIPFALPARKLFVSGQSEESDSDRA